MANKEAVRSCQQCLPLVSVLMTVKAGILLVLAVSGRDGKFHKILSA